MVIPEHTAKAFDVDLQELARLVAEMGGLTEKQVADSVDALVRRDPERAQQIVAADVSIDALQREIEDKAVLTIARRQPMAVDLRELVGALRLCNDLERIGDLAKNIAKRVMVLDAELHSTKVIRGVQHMGALVLAQLKQKKAGEQNELFLDSVLTKLVADGQVKIHRDAIKTLTASFKR